MQFDFVIAGAGSAGSVIAARLSEDPSVRVLLLEAGGEAGQWDVRMPLAVERLLRDGPRNWNFMTEPEQHLGGRRVQHPRGRLLGGSSSINGMVYTRGHALDFEGWETKYGCAGWGYRDVLPYFKKAETSERGENLYRGGKGPLMVRNPDLTTNPLNLAFMEAGRQAGYPSSNDSNAELQEGFAPNEQTINTGERCGAMRAYLAEARVRPNLKIATGALIDRLNFEGKRCIGLDYVVNGEARTVRAEREVIVCSGAFGSPAILLRSGIGPADGLRALGIPVVADLPGVGRNLQDHPDIAIQFRAKGDLGLYRHTRSPRREIAGLQWFLNRSGVAASNQFEAAAYIRTRPGIEHPNLKWELLPLAFMPDSFEPRPKPSFQIHMTLLRAKSRGHVRLQSKDSRTPPAILFNYLQAEEDRQAYRDALRLTRELVKQPALAAVSDGEIYPGPGVRSDDEVDAWFRENLATAYHPGGTCRMGSISDPQAVVGPDLRVIGLEGIRVADASIMPEEVSANLNATTIMIGEKASDIIAGKPPLPPVEAGWWVNPDWRTVQR